MCEISKLGISDDDVSDIHRIGNPARAGRAMLKVKFDSHDVKQTVIRNSKQLRGSHSNVYINPDRTPLQQSQHKRLRLELKHRRECGEDFIIHKNQVIPRALELINIRSLRRNFDDLTVFASSLDHY